MNIRAARKARLKAWSSDRSISAILQSSVFAAFDGSTAAPTTLTRAFRATYLDANGKLKNSEDYYGTPKSLSLLDALPFYMALSAAFTQLRGSQITRPWMILTARYMLAAVLEQVLAFGTVGQHIIAETFAYGFHVLSDGLDLHIDPDDLLIQNMFGRGPDDQINNGEVDDWKDIRDTHMNVVSELTAKPV